MMENPDSNNTGLLPEEIIARIKKALVHGGETYTWEDIRTGIIEGHFQIFWNEHGACVTQICTPPQKRYLNCFVVAGELPGVMDLSQEVEDFGRSMGCQFMTTSARMGWKKVLPNYGWKESQVVFTKGLN